MQNTAYMTDNFESQKNRKASGYTLLICVLLAVILIFVRWTTPVIIPPNLDEGIEVNLGNSDQGLGIDQPLHPGKPAAIDKQVYTPPPKQAVIEKEPAKDVETDDKNADAPVIKKPAVTKPDATKIPVKDVVTRKPVTVMKPVITPTPPKAKAQFHGVNGTGTGGNDADDYKPGNNQGVAGGHGDQGKPGGNPNSNNYNGNGGTGNSGVSISRGLQGRYFTKVYKYEGDFNENARVAIDVQVDKSGNVLSATYQLRGSTTAESYYKDKAIDIVKKSKLNADPNGSDEQVGTVVVQFKVRG
jgi:outer membrane biosynthesis protein TonB